MRLGRAVLPGQPWSREIGHGLSAAPPQASKKGQVFWKPVHGGQGCPEDSGQVAGGRWGAGRVRLLSWGAKQ